MKNPTCPTCHTEASLERGDVLILTRTPTLVTEDILVQGYTFAGDEDTIVVLKTCWHCWRMEANPDKVHRIRVSSWRDTLIFDYPTRDAAEKDFGHKIREHTGERQPDTTLKIVNKLGEVVHEVSVKNGNPDLATWRAKFDPFVIRWEDAFWRDSIRRDDESSAQEVYQRWISRLEMGDTGSGIPPKGVITVSLLGRSGGILESRRFHYDDDQWQTLRDAHRYDLELWHEGADCPFHRSALFPYRAGDPCGNLKIALNSFQYWREKQDRPTYAILRHKASGEIVQRFP